jgi:hypothetical protein
MAKESFDFVDIGSLFQQVGGKAMTKGVNTPGVFQASFFLAW